MIYVFAKGHIAFVEYGRIVGVRRQYSQSLNEVLL